VQKIASTQELQQELRNLLVQASAPNPSRVRLAAQLNQLAHRVQGDESVTDYRGKSISEIARAIRKHWKQVNFAAKPYLDAMLSLEKIDDDYGEDSGRMVVNYFLGNASQFKGPEAKAIKAELKRLLASRGASLVEADSIPSKLMHMIWQVPSAIMQLVWPIRSRVEWGMRQVSVPFKTEAEAQRFEGKVQTGVRHDTENDITVETQMLSGPRPYQVVIGW